MVFERSVTLRGGEALLVRSLEETDALAVIWQVRKASGETRNMVREPQEWNVSVSQEAEFLRKTLDDPHAVMFGAFIGQELVGSASVNPVSVRNRVRHRGVFGISILKKYWHMGVGTELTKACIDAARTAGYEQLELEVVENNARAVALYQRLGFETVGRLPHAIKYSDGSYADFMNMVLYL